MQFVTPLAPFVAGWVLLFFTADLARLGLVNGIGQLVLFAFAVCLPVWKTGRMSYVDIGWPLGVAVIGAGWMTKQLVDYSMEKCGFYVIMANRTLSRAEARSIQVLGRT